MSKKIVQKCPKKRVSKKKRIEILRNEINKYGLWNLNKVKFSKKFNVSDRSIRRDISDIVNNYPKSELNVVRFNLSYAFDRSIEENVAILNNKQSTPSERINATRALALTGREYNNMLENFGLKPKIADTIHSTNVDLTIKDIRKIWLNSLHYEEDEDGALRKKEVTSPRNTK